MEIIRHPIHTANIHPLERCASLAGGGMLLFSGARQGRGGLLRMLFGAEMLRRAVTGHCYLYEGLGVRTAPTREGSHSSLPYELGIGAQAAITIGRSREEVFAFWRDLHNLPRFMQHLESVEVRDNRHSHWVAQGPAGARVEWDSEIINEVDNELIAWRSLEGSDVDSAGSVQFKDAPGGRGTEIRVKLQYNPPAGMVGAIVASLFGKEPEQEIKSDLARLKQVLETGVVSTTEGQATGRDAKTQRLNRKPMAQSGSRQLECANQ